MSHNVQDSVQDVNKKSSQYTRPACLIHVGKEHFAAWNNVAEKKRKSYTYSFAQAVKTSGYSVDEFKKAVIHFRKHKTMDEYIELLKLARLHVDSNAASRGKYHNQGCKAKLIAKVMHYAKFGDTRLENDLEQRNPDEDPLGSEQKEKAANKISEAKQNKSVPHADRQTRNAVQSKAKDQGHCYVTNISPHAAHG